MPDVLLNMITISIPLNDLTRVRSHLKYYVKVRIARLGYALKKINLLDDVWHTSSISFF